MKLKVLTLIKRFTWLDWLILALLLVLVIYLLMTIALRSLKKPPVVEYSAKAEVAGVSRDIWVDVSGAVVAPGVYKLLEGDRVKDALVAAGGVSSTADRAVLAKEVNLAAVVTDGQKIYIRETEVAQPTASPARNASHSDAGGQFGGQAGAKTTDKINLNSASLSELDSLWGVGAVRAGEIIKNRPYGKVEELLTKKIVTKSVFEKIKDQITVY